MYNDRPIKDPNLRAALREIQVILDRRKIAGGVMVVSKSESAWTYNMTAPWSAIKPDDASPMGFRMRAVSAEIGNEKAHELIGGAAHTICSLMDFGFQTAGWMEELLAMLQAAGVQITHVPFGGKPVPRLTNIRPD